MKSAGSQMDCMLLKTIYEWVLHMHFSTMLEIVLQIYIDKLKSLVSDGAMLLAVALSIHVDTPSKPMYTFHGLICRTE